MQGTMPSAAFVINRQGTVMMYIQKILFVMFFVEMAQMYANQESL